MRDSSMDLSVRRPSYASTIGKNIESESSMNTLNAKVSTLMSSCRICLSSMFDPAALTCGHRFCEGCLDKYWRVKDKPDCIVCPLCRASAFNVRFAKKEKPSTEEFRRMFNPIVLNQTDVNNAIIWCLKISAVMPVIYFLLKWLKPNIVQLFTAINLKLAQQL
ncbi:uncharacterized protein LOC142980031 [Anticarsia gemmatalis]|uniref:uncharacterized protein LOC142980031 n=1 Tax=Anticarsia gemmatalis TaxID=129554 RepID=UPI003F759AD7